MKDVYVRYHNLYVAILLEENRNRPITIISFAKIRKNVRTIWEQINKLKNNNSITYPKIDVNLLNDIFSQTWALAQLLT